MLKHSLLRATTPMFVCAALSAAGCQGAASVVRVDDAPTRMDSATIAVNGTHLFYETTGAGPVVVLVHGGNLDRRMWDPQFIALAREHRVIRYDARGYGRSGPADAPFQAHEDLVALLGALKIQRASLVGLSLGGRIAIDFALTHPEMIDRLVLAAPGISGWEFAHGDTAWWPDSRAARSRGDSVAMSLAWLKSDYMRPAMERPELAARLRELTAANSSYWMGILKHGDLERPASPPALQRTRMLRARTLLVVGTRDNADIMGIADTLTATVPDLRRVTLEGAGHMLNMEQPALFNELVLEFLRPAVSRPDRNVITADELASVPEVDLYAAVQRLRPEFIPKPCPEPDNSRICRAAAESDMPVYVDDVLRGRLEALHRYSTGDVREVRRLSGPEATRRFGAANGAGAIVVTRKQTIAPPTSEAAARAGRAGACGSGVTACG